MSGPVIETRLLEHDDDAIQFLARTYAVLGNATRLRTVFLLIQETELTVRELSRRFHIAEPAMRGHLAQLVRHHVVQKRQRGKFNFYSLCDPPATRKAFELLARFAVR